MILASKYFELAIWVKCSFVPAERDDSERL